MDSIAKQLVQPGKGILAADESTPTVGKRLAKHGLENTEEIRKAYRDLFLTAPGIGDFLSGCILHKETLYQTSLDGTPFVSLLSSSGILVGIKVDEGLDPLASAKESHTQGLETLEDRCREYSRQGAKFSKWRAAFAIGENTPSESAIKQNCDELAKFAAISQRCGLVPIVEPEILIDGDHDIRRSAEVADLVLDAVFAKLKAERVRLEACLLKIQMIMPGSEGPKVTAEEIAVETVSLLVRKVPRQLAGIVFLSGGLSEEEATVNLNAINKFAIGSNQKFWGLTFSYGRALQASALTAWSTDTSSPDSRHYAQQLAVQLASANSLASIAQYVPPHPSKTKGNLKEGFRGWK